MTVSCEQWHDLIWDQLYELLEEDQALALRAHLAGCPECQKSLSLARAQQQRLARAARLEIQVPLFVAPGEEPRVLPLPAVRKSRLVGSFVAAAAILLVTVGLPLLVYEGQRAQGEREFADAAQALNQVVKDRSSLKQQVHTAQAAFVERARGQHMRLQVLGPAALEPGATGTHRVRVTDLEGKPLDADVTARILAADNRELHTITQRTTKGLLVVSLPATLPHATSDLRLDVTAVAADARASLREPLQGRATELVTHLAVSKLLYQPGDVMFFRSVTLDRFTQQPVPPGQAVRYTLADPTGQIIHRARADLAQGGLAGGAIELPRQGLREGEYTLTVADADGRFPAQSQRVHVQRPVRLKKVLEFDKPGYQPGDMLRATVRAHRLLGGQAVAKTLVTGIVKIDGKPVGTAIRTQTDSEGAAHIEMPLPRQAGRLYRLTVVINDPGNAEALERDIPLTGPALAVEFFPEGGQLVAGVPNRVYYRARTVRGEPADVRAVLVDGRGQQVATVSGRGLGVFRFTPEPGMAYSLRLASHDEMLPLPEVHEFGVVLSTPQGVVNPGTPLHAVVQAGGAPRQLVVAAFCRGRLVAYEPLSVTTGPTEVQLIPPADLGGVFRLTVFDELEGLRPVAERLVYRVPAKSLNLAVESRVSPAGSAERASLTIRARQEDGLLTSAWLLAAVVDPESAGLQESAGAAGLPAHFHLLSELRRPEDLEDANFLLSHHPQAREALDLYLGTQGWRAFTPSAVARSEQGSEARPAVAALVKLDSAAAAWREMQQALAPELATLQKDLGARDQKLLAEQVNHEAAASGAKARLEDFQHAARSALLPAVLVLALMGCVLAALAAASRSGRVLGSRLRPYLAGVSAALLVGSVIDYLVLHPRLEQSLSQPLPLVEQGPLDFPSPVALASAVPERQEGRVHLEREAGVPPPALTASRLESLVERRTLASGAAGRPIRTVVQGEYRAYVATLSLERPPAVKPVPELPEAKAVARVYAYLPDTAVPPSGDLPDTVLWHPVLFAEGGTAQLDVVLPRRDAVYQVLLQGHTADGRLGFLRTELKATAP